MQRSTCILLLLCVVQVAFSAVFRMRVEQTNFFNIEPIENGPVCQLGEGPYWDPIKKALFYVDAFAGIIHRFDTETKISTQHSTGKLSSIVIPVEGSDNEVITTLYNKLIKLNWETKQVQEITSVPESERFNDAKVDSAGRLWIGTIKMDDNKQIIPLAGSLYKLVGNQLVVMSSNYSISNGMAWNKNNTLMFFNDSEDQKTFVFDFNAKDGTIANRRLLIDYKNNTNFNNEYPDGMAIDKNDEIWIALYNGARIIRISADGRLLASIKVPAAQTTSLTFAGTNYDTLYVTTGNETSVPAEQPNAGKVFRIKQKIGVIPNDEPQIQGLSPNRIKM